MEGFGEEGFEPGCERFQRKDWEILQVKEGKWRDTGARCHQWSTNFFHDAGPAVVGKGPCTCLPGRC